MIAAPTSARLSHRFGPRLVTGTGMTIFGLTMFSYALVSADVPLWVIEVMMFCMGTGMGLTMSPATNAIMGAVPREKAGAGSAVNNTVRQVASALGVAILGSILAVVFRSHLGSDTPAQVASKLDQPAAVVSQLPGNLQVKSFVDADTSQSIGNTFEFLANAEKALESRGQLPSAAALTPAQQATIQKSDRRTLGAFLAKSKTSFMSGMHVTSVFSGLSVLLGALIAFLFLPSRREFGAMHAAPPGPAPASGESDAVMVH
jgi:MFS family permease